MDKRKRKAVRLGDALHGWARSVDPGDKRSQARAVSVWDEIAGEEVSAHTVGLTTRKGELVVHVDSHAWAAQLSLMAEDFRQSVNLALGEELLSGVRFTVSRTVHDEREKKQRERDIERRYGGEKLTPSPLTTGEQEEIERLTQAAKSKGLREAAAKAQARAREWEKAREARRRRDRSSRTSRGGETEQLP